MKKRFAFLLAAALLCTLAGCRTPDSLQLDLAQGHGDNIQLLHLNASTREKEERILAFRQVIEDAEPLDKDISLFAYYPDYVMELKTDRDPEGVTVVIDVNGEYVDFFYPGPHPARSDQLYRSHTTAEDLIKLVHKVV